MPEFTKASLQFQFRLKNDTTTRDELIFAKKEELIVLNFETESVRTFYTFKQPLKR
jgi:hypothetical protein